jgi:hypothetical protein
VLPTLSVEAEPTRSDEVYADRVTEVRV